MISIYWKISVFDSAKDGLNGDTKEVETMLWLDGLLALPTIGIQLVPSLKEISLFNDGLNDFTDHLFQEYSDINIEVKDIWGYTLNAKKVGLLFSLSHNNLVMSSGYHVEKKPRPGKLPGFEMPELKSYSENFDLLYGHFKKLFNSLKDLRDLKFNRIGIVAETNISQESLPPGAEKWIKSLEESLGNTLIHSKTSLLARVFDDEDHSDQCHHIVDFDDSKPELGIHLKLDWQRLFKNSVILEQNNTLKSIDTCGKAAFEYFEKFGEGNLENG